MTSEEGRLNSVPSLSEEVIKHIDVLVESESDPRQRLIAVMTYLMQQPDGSLELSVADRLDKEELSPLYAKFMEKFRDIEGIKQKTNEAINAYNAKHGIDDVTFE